MRKLFILCLSLVMAVGIGASASAAPVLDISFDIIGDPLTDPLTPFTVDIIGNITDSAGGSTDFAGFGFELQYDESVLNIVDASIDATVWNFPFVGTSITSEADADGLIQMGGAAFPLTPSPAVLGSIIFQFETLNASSSLTILEYPTDVYEMSVVGELLPLDGDLTLPDGSPAFVVQVTNDPSAVPIPGTLVLFGSGLVGLVGWRRRNRG